MVSELKTPELGAASISPQSQEQNPNPTRVCESFQREERDNGVVTREEIDGDDFGGERATDKLAGRRRRE
jgi:hypothetical protein